ncbi:hypothetical protein LB505_013546 [Fusarium chuoi]|nr:hypothetical protein LB505_013546 [Fusarium chuoi]
MATSDSWWHCCRRMYNVPSFTLARTVGGLFAWYWTHIARRTQTPLIILASVRVLSIPCRTHPDPFRDSFLARGS